jgi:hypothetical protein
LYPLVFQRDSLRNMSSSTSDSDKFDSARRRLCPDGACIGLLDDAGTCKECGLTASGERLQTLPVDQIEELEADDDVAAAPPELPADAREAGGFDPKRKLCPDGSCVGVIGADGRCKVCGQGA